MPGKGLDPADSDFFRALTEVVFANPFSAERAQQVSRIVPGIPFGDLTTNREALARAVEPRLESVMRDGQRPSRRLNTEERRLVELA